MESVALVWAQFAAYHMDRCEAVARRLAGRCLVQGIEIATTSDSYAWEPSGELSHAEKITLFPGQALQDISAWQRFRALLRATWRSQTVCIGVSYAEPEVIALTWLLRLCGKRVIAFSESKFDDVARSIWLELLKSLALSCYSAAIVGGARHIAYFHFLGFRRRPVLPGYDTVGVERIRNQAVARPAGPERDFAERPFVFVGRFVEKKNLYRLIDGYRAYKDLAGQAARRLVLVGSGELEPDLRQKIAGLGVTGDIDLPGFLGAGEVAQVLAGALALVLVSCEEQWGLVVNEALAVGLPVIASGQVGSCDALVRNLVNGFVVESGSAEAIGRAMYEMAADAGQWQDMAKASRARAWLGDAERLADAIELLLFPGAEPAGERCRAMLGEMDR